jgi:uncharacterized protein YndB with AHSA1/START domain
MTDTYKIDPNLDLVLERIVEVKPELVWKAWTQPEHVKKWLTPAPWKTVDCEIDLRPGGVFRFVMQSPEGQQFPNVGCFLEVVENRKLVWTVALLPGFRPAARPENGADLFFTAIILIEPHLKGTKYAAIAIHPDQATCKKHKEMGFHEGWGKALDQLVELAKNTLT